ncbi:c-type cytochrome [Verticiella sediminum]|uniref:C-type cytochrome n=1 Tax=Verticiella sediminum TaxID=1247510 RepID=A0A556AXG7_9BURK|nr:c-type cytochrome [Verticiella sediminum]TSH97643.1 c-type cytochrome [Verticiella sediminum]
MSGMPPGPAEATPVSRVERPVDCLHGLMLRPPVVLWDGARYRGSRLVRAPLADARSQPGVVSVVQCAEFIGVVAVGALYAGQALASLAPVWRAPEGGVHEAPAGTPPASAGVSHADAPSTPARYVWRTAGSDVPAGIEVVVWCADHHAGVWLPPCPAPAQWLVRRELAALLRLAPDALELHVLEGGASGLHPLSLMDAAAEAALLSQAVGRPVGVPCRGEHPAALALSAVPADAFGADAPAEDAVSAPPPRAGATGPRLRAESPWGVRPSLARLLSEPDSAHAVAGAGVQPAGAVAAGRGAVAGAAHVGVHELNAAQVFAQESLWHEQALARGEDPLAWRVRQMPDGPGRVLAQQVVESAALGAHAPQRGPASDGLLHGRGLATAQVQCTDDDGGSRMVWSAWVAQVRVQPRTGEVDVTRVVAGQDSAHLQAVQVASTHRRIVQDPALLASARELLGAPAAFDDWAPRAGAGTTDGGGDSALARHTGALAPAAQGAVAEGRLAVDGVLTLPAAAAIANAIHDATGVRLREAPFEREALRLALSAGAGAARRPGRLRRGWAWLASGAAGLAGLAAMAWPVKPALPLTEGPDVSLYSEQVIERGRLVAAAGDCIACHTAPGGAPNAGGFALETPFGTIYSTNITPDNETGIGRWSYAAFERAMREGIHQDGRQLYPAFPYTAFAKLSDADMQALYGYLMAQPPVQAEAPETRLAFPYSLRPAIAGWNALFHDPTPFTPDPGRSVEWNRGAYLVQGAGHCAACHSPRNSLGAEKTGIHYLAGGAAEGWQAPALNRLADGPLPWTREELYQYLRTGYAARHGVAAGPMAPVIHGLAELPDSDVRAITTYLMALPGETDAGGVASAQAGAKAAAAPAGPAGAPAQADTARLFPQHANGERIYQNACAVCHEAGSGPTLFGVKPLLGLNTNLHAATPDNLIQVILNGIQTPADDALGYMPAFRDSLDDRQIADLVGYLRSRFAPGQPAWREVADAAGRMRAAGHTTHEQGEAQQAE